jgi:hypothetical protein
VAGFLGFLDGLPEHANGDLEKKELPRLAASSWDSIPSSLPLWTPGDIEDASRRKTVVEILR